MWVIRGSVSVPPDQVQGDRGSAAKRWWSITGITRRKPIFSSSALLSPHKLIRLRLGKLKIISDDHGRVIFELPVPPTNQWRVLPGQASRSQCSGATPGKLTWSTPTALTWGQTWPREDGCWGTVLSARSMGGSFREVTASAWGFLMLKKVNPHMNAATQSQGRNC